MASTFPSITFDSTNAPVIAEWLTAYSVDTGDYTDYTDAQIAADSALNALGLSEEVLTDMCEWVDALKGDISASPAHAMRTIAAALHTLYTPR